MDATAGGVSVRLLQALRDWAPREGARIGPVPERYGFAVMMAVAVVLLVVAVLLL